MSSDSEKLLKPSKRRRPIMSDSDSSEDSFIITNRGKKKVGRIVSEGDSDSDGSDIPLYPVQKKHKNKPVIVESSYSSGSSEEEMDFAGGSTSAEWESDWESVDESAEPGKTRRSRCKKPSHKSPDTKQADSSSEQSDGESEKCPICLLSFRKQEVGNPAVCDHCFCLDCITEWSKNMNTCPVDRQKFEVINVRAKIGGEILRYMPVEEKTQNVDVVQEDPTYCEVCRQCTREDRMLLCDGCDSGYHLECLDPPMEEVPIEEHWYCPECSRNVENDAEAIEIDLDEVPDLLAEARILGHGYGRSRAYHAAYENGVDALMPGASRNRRNGNVLARTRQAERVRANVRAVRTRRAAAEVAERYNSPGIVLFDTDDSSGLENALSRDSALSPSRPGPSSSRRGPTSRVRERRAARKVSKKKRKVRRKKRTKTAEEMREVRIQEVNSDGEIVDIVTYVRAGPSSSSAGAPLRRRKKRKKLKVRRARTAASVAASLKTSKRRIAARIINRINSAAANGDAVQITSKSRLSSSNVGLRVSRHQAGISQVNLFGVGLGIDYSPPGSGQ